MPMPPPQSCRSSTLPRRISRALPTSRQALGKIWISRRRGGSRPARLLTERGADQLDCIIARPFGRAGNRANLATLWIYEQRGRHAERAADGLEVLKRAGAGVGVVGEFLYANFFQPGLRLVSVAGVDVDRHDLETGTAEPLFQAIKRGHFRAAGHAPGSPQVEQHCAPAPVLERQRLSGGICKR